MWDKTISVVACATLEITSEPTLCLVSLTEKWIIVILTHGKGGGVLGGLKILSVTLSAQRKQSVHASCHFIVLHSS